MVLENARIGNYICEPIYEIDGKLLAFELLTRFIGMDRSSKASASSEFIINLMSYAMKERLLTQQMELISAHAEYFQKQGVFLSINIDSDMAEIIIANNELRARLQSLPFIRLEINENFPNLTDGRRNPLLNFLSQHFTLWLDDFGSGKAHFIALNDRLFEYVKINKEFYWEQVNNPIFLILIGEIAKFCQGIIVEGVERQEQAEELYDTGIHAMQGYLWPDVALENIGAYRSSGESCCR